MARTGATLDEVRDAVRAYVARRARLAAPPGDEEPLAERGFVPSVELLDLALFLEDEFGVVLEGRDATPDRLRTIGALARTVVARLSAGQGQAAAPGPPADPPTAFGFRHRRSPTHAPPRAEELLGAGLFIAEEGGRLGLADGAARLSEALDALLRARCIAPFGARERDYPTLLPLGVAVRSGVLRSFPQHATFCVPVADDDAQQRALGELAARDPGLAATGGPALAAHLGGVEGLLQPAVCYHAYAELAGRGVGAGIALTARGRCFRSERAGGAGLERGREFTMRELVFVGPSAWCEAQRREAAARVGEVVELLGLDGWTEPANDPFFLPAEGGRRALQARMGAKYEVRLALPYAGGSLAAASLNLHGEFFARAFGLSAEGGTAVTACVAFGLERWVWALYAQHGTDVAAWPEAARRLLSG